MRYNILLIEKKKIKHPYYWQNITLPLKKPKSLLDFSRSGIVIPYIKYIKLLNFYNLFTIKSYLISHIILIFLPMILIVCNL